MPEGDWFCIRCKPDQEPLQKKKRKTFVYTEEDEEAEEDEKDYEESDEDSDQSTLESLFSDSQ